MQTQRDQFPLDFLIIGTMKSGTSSLSAYLTQHPQIGIPDREVHFFDRFKDEGLDWYRNVLLESGGNDARVYGEKTPFYAWSDEIAQDIHALRPDAKLIWLFRDPISRLTSHYKHNLKGGWEWKSIDSALKAEPKRMSTHLQYGYMMGSRYDEQVKRYLKLFPKEQMMFLTFEEFVNDPIAYVHDVCKFIGVDRFDFTEIPPANEGFNLRFPSLAYFLRSTIGTNNRIYHYAFQLNRTDQNKKVKLNSSLEEKLKSELRPSVQFLRDECGLDVSFWKDYGL